MDALHEVFVLWPPDLPDLSVCDFYMHGNLKQKVYSNNPHTLMALKINIRSVIHNITYGELHKSNKIPYVSNRCVLMQLDTIFGIFEIQVRQNFAVTLNKKLHPGWKRSHDTPASICSGQENRISSLIEVQVPYIWLSLY